MNTFSNETCLNVKHQCFIFQHIVQIYLNTYPIYKQVSECILEKPMLAAVQANDEQLIAHPYLMRIPANLLHRSTNMCFWSCQTLFTIYWTHMRVNGIWTKSFCRQKTNNRMLFLTGCFQGYRRHINRLQMTPQ